MAYAGRPRIGRPRAIRAAGCVLVMLGLASFARDVAQAGDLILVTGVGLATLGVLGYAVRPCSAPGSRRSSWTRPASSWAATRSASSTGR